jgi:uncharacterized protein (TIGR02145 family)
MSSKDYIYCYQGSALRVAGGTAVIGEVYKPAPMDEVTIGSQTWTSKNLSIDDGQGGIYTQTVNYGQGDVIEYYYTWNAAVRVAATVEGWHLPTSAEWGALATAVGGTLRAGTKLKSSYGWSSGKGTDDYGFAAFPAGYWTSSFSGKGSYAIFWTATEYSSYDAYYHFFDTGASMGSYHDDKHYNAFSVRLVKDAE